MKIPILASKIDLSNKGLKEIPPDIFKCKNLKKLNLSNNLIKSIPPEIGNLKSLKNLDLSNNQLSVLLAKFFSLKNLEILILNNNRLKNIPKQIRELQKLKKLAVAGNQLTELPIELNTLRNLNSLNLANNQLTMFPGQLVIDNLEELWLNKNPFTSFSAKAITDQGINLKSLFCFSSMYGIAENINAEYAKLQQKKGNNLSELKLLSLKSKIELPNKLIKKMSEDTVNEKGNGKSIFISYSHADETWLKELTVPLKVLGYENLNIESWDDTKLKAGDEWEAGIQQALNNADIAILLVSSNFLASNYVRKKELPQILDNAILKGTIILPIVVRLCRYNESPLGKLQTLNTPSNPMNQMSEAERDKVYFDLCKRIEEISTS